MAETIIYEKKGHIAYFTINRPEAMNAFDFATIRHLRAEAREKLTRVRPESLAQAGRISGITPADMALLAVYLGGN